MTAPLNNTPPVCPLHAKVMMLYFYDRPGGPAGNNWSCPDCIAARKRKEERKEEKEAQAKTRFPEGAEL